MGTSGASCMRTLYRLQDSHIISLLMRLTGQQLVHFTRVERLEDEEERRIWQELSPRSSVVYLLGSCGSTEWLGTGLEDFFLSRSCMHT